MVLKGNLAIYVLRKKVGDFLIGPNRAKLEAHGTATGTAADVNVFGPLAGLAARLMLPDAQKLYSSSSH